MSHFDITVCYWILALDFRNFYIQSNQISKVRIWQILWFWAKRTSHPSSDLWPPQSPDVKNYKKLINFSNIAHSLKFHIDTISKAYDRWPSRPISLILWAKVSLGGKEWIKKQWANKRVNMALVNKFHRILLQNSNHMVTAAENVTKTYFWQSLFTKIYLYFNKQTTTSNLSLYFTQFLGYFELFWQFE